ncbi:zinc-finger homeodomain protein 9 [Brachypodium distachyon]|nr:zinc-finger homeodomain protein 9 [Brachypodium distachyon]|eukprot:XP_010230244.1 zinc-finger homeodomain protein 9 [Brachypodium distachyon]
MSDVVSVRKAMYLDCIRNHAVALGQVGHCLDGCTEFVQPLGSRLNCEGCGCHRSFHRRVMFDVSISVSVSPTPQPQPPQRQPVPTAVLSGDSSATESDEDDFQRSVPAPQQQRRAPVAVAQQQQQQHYPAPLPMMVVAPEQVKRPRASFTTEQKTKMEELSERIGWFYKQRNRATIEEGCREIGVTSSAFKNWMNNTKTKRNKLRRASVSANNNNAAPPAAASCSPALPPPPPAST